MKFPELFEPITSSKESTMDMPDKDIGERGCACIRHVPGTTIDTEAVKRFMEEKGASKLLLPERFEIVKVLPFTEAGKHDKKALRKDIKEKPGLP
jgi:2,3-dihydroxybenzoate-AMP ligase/mycobactin salicyl-AMP ligase